MKVSLIMCLSILLTIILTKFQIPIIKSLKFGQPIREEGNKEHLKKIGTPTMGGISFLIVFFILSLIFVKLEVNTVFILLSTLIFGLIGFIDDYEKVSKQKNLGLTESQKFLLQVVVSLVLVGVFYFILPKNMGDIEIPLFNNVISMGVFSIPVIVFILVGSVNAVNFTDGIDGLLSSVSIPVFIGISLISLFENASITNMSIIFAGVLIGFLVFNSNPASIFMGDTGSMAIGGAIVSMLIVLNKPVYMMIIGGVYFIEAISVILQRFYYKKTKGKRLFKMTPIHHHFEIEGYKEPKIVAGFCTASILLTLLTLTLLGVV